MACIFYIWWDLLDSNQRPHRCERCALPTELKSQVPCYYSVQGTKNQVSSLLFRNASFPVAFQDRRQILSRIAFLYLGYLLWRSCGNDGAAFISAFRPQVYNLVRCFNHIQIMLDDHHGIPALYQLMQDLYQPIHIGNMQPSSRLI